MLEGYAKFLWTSANEELERSKKSMEIGDWTEAVFKAQQSIEKGFKAVGAYFMNLSESELKERYSHKTLKLYGEIVKQFIIKVNASCIKSAENKIKNIIRKSENEKNKELLKAYCDNLGIQFAELYFGTKLNLIASELPEIFSDMESRREDNWRMSLGLLDEDSIKMGFFDEMNEINESVMIFFGLHFKIVGIDFEKICNEITQIRTKDDLEKAFKKIERGIKKKINIKNVDWSSIKNTLFEEGVLDIKNLIFDLKEDIKYILFLDAHENISRYSIKGVDIKKLYTDKSDKIVEMVNGAENILRKLDNVFLNDV